jgi:hypothetical protein
MRCVFLSIIRRACFHLSSFLRSVQQYSSVCGASFKAVRITHTHKTLSPPNKLQTALCPLGAHLYLNASMYIKFLRRTISPFVNGKARNQLWDLNKVHVNSLAFKRNVMLMDKILTCPIERAHYDSQNSSL